MLTARRTALPAAALLALACAAAAAGAQTPDRCVKGVHALPGVGAGAAETGALRRLSWRDSHESYLAARAAGGDAAALDSVDARARRLFAAMRLDDEETRAFLVRVADLRTAVANGAPPSFGTFQPRSHPLDPDVVRLFGRPGDGAPVDVSFAADARRAVALCAASDAAYAYLDFLTFPQVAAAAERYARLSRRWEQYVEHGYSMTLLERLAHSCRLGGFGAVVAPTAFRRCLSGGDPSLGPPSVRTVFLHPSGGVVPVLESGEDYRTAAVVEWYGLLWHAFPDEKLTTLGVSVATAYADRGPRRVGALVHVPVPFLGTGAAKVGVFEARGGDTSWRDRIVLTADLIGWVPGNRRRTAAAVGSARSAAYVGRLGDLARQRLAAR